MVYILTTARAYNITAISLVYVNIIRCVHCFATAFPTYHLVFLFGNIALFNYLHRLFSFPFLKQGDVNIVVSLPYLTFEVTIIFIFPIAYPLLIVFLLF